MTSERVRLVIRRAMADPEFEAELLADPIRVFHEYGMSTEDRALFEGLSPQRLQGIAEEEGLWPPNTELDISDQIKAWLDDHEDPLKELRLAGALIGRGEPPSTYEPALQRFFGRLDADIEVGITAADINAIIQYVLREAYMETSRDLAFHASQIEHYNERKRRLQQEIKRTRSHLTLLEEQLLLAGDDLGLVNRDLQNATQKQQQFLTLMSNLNKMMHDIAMAIIRNVKA